MNLYLLSPNQGIPPNLEPDVILCLDLEEYGVESIFSRIDMVYARLNQEDDSNATMFFPDVPCVKPSASLVVLGYPNITSGGDVAAPQNTVALAETVQQIVAAGAIYIPKPGNYRSAGSVKERSEQLKQAWNVKEWNQPPASSPACLAQSFSSIPNVIADGYAKQSLSEEEREADRKIYANPPFQLTEDEFQKYILTDQTDKAEP